jgi:hypothetical protein
MNTKASVILAILAIVIVTSMVAVAVAVGFTTSASADPWSWGQPPSQNWLRGYYSDSHDCSNVW